MCTLVKASNAELSIRMISGNSLLTMVLRFLSHSTGTLTRPEYFGSAADRFRSACSCR